MEHEQEEREDQDYPDWLPLILWGTEPRFCAYCWRPMEWIGPQLRCPQECGAGGHVSEHFIQEQRALDPDRAARAAANHPDLAAIDERRHHADPWPD